MKSSGKIAPPKSLLRPGLGVIACAAALATVVLAIAFFFLTGKERNVEEPATATAPDTVGSTDVTVG